MPIARPRRAWPRLPEERSAAPIAAPRERRLSRSAGKLLLRVSRTLRVRQRASLPARSAVRRRHAPAAAGRFPLREAGGKLLRLAATVRMAEADSLTAVRFQCRAARRLTAVVLHPAVAPRPSVAEAGWGRAVAGEA